MTWLDVLLLGFAAGALWFGARRVITRAYVRVNPRYRQLLERHALNSPRAFLNLPAVIISGHPDRNVSRVTLGTGEDVVHAYLKREHRVRWKQRLANLWSGYGPVSVSHREALTLRRLRRAGIHCPEWIAVGADGQGRAFLVVETLGDGMDLRRYLADLDLSPQDRRRFARHLGKTLAGLHNAGFSHPDLYAKHVLVHADDLRISFLDWQRSRRPHHVSLEKGWRDLAALDATLADDQAPPRERLVCLRAYLAARLAATIRNQKRSTGCQAFDGRLLPGDEHVTPAAAVESMPPSRLNERALLHRALAAIREHRAPLLRRRHIHEARQKPAVKQELIWLDGEALCVTPEFQLQHNGALPNAGPLSRNEVACAKVALPRGGQGFFLRRRRNHFFAWLAAWFGGRPVATPEVRQAGLLFRLQRYGVRTARLLAFGQRQVSPWRIESFLLTEPPTGSRSVTEWLARSATGVPHTATLRQRRFLLREIGQVFQRVHAAGCHLHDEPCAGEEIVPLLAVQEVEEDRAQRPRVTLARVDGLRLSRHLNEDRVATDFARLRRRQQLIHLTRTDELRVILAYLGRKRLTDDGKRCVRRVAALTDEVGV